MALRALCSAVGTHGVSWRGAFMWMDDMSCALQHAAWRGVGGHQGGTRLLMYFLAIAWAEGGEKGRQRPLLPGRAS